MVNLVSVYLLQKHKKIYFIIPWSIYQIILDLFLFFKQFQSHCVLKFSLIQKSKSSTNLNHKEGKQNEATIN